MQSHAEASFNLESNQIGLPWSAVEHLVDFIKVQFQDSLYIPERVVALGKGAVVPARLLASEGTLMFYEGIKSYKGEFDQGEINNYQKIPYMPELNRPDTLIVDDLWDTGTTFRYAKRLWPMATYCALISKQPAEDTFLDYIGMIFPTTMWFVMPWER